MNRNFDECHVGPNPFAEDLKKVGKAVELVAELRRTGQLTPEKIAEISGGLPEGFRKSFLEHIRSHGLTGK